MATAPTPFAPSPGKVWDPVANMWVTGGTSPVYGEGQTIDERQYGGRGAVLDEKGNPIAGTSSADQEYKRYGFMANQGQPGAPQIDQTQSNEARGLSMDALGMLRDRASGGQTPADQLAQQQTQGAVQGIQSGAASIKGGAMARAAASRAATASGARVQAMGNQDAAALHARGQADAANQYFGAAGAQRGQDLGLATSQAQLQAGQNAANDQHKQFYDQKAWETGNTANNTNLGVSGQDNTAQATAAKQNLEASKAQQANADRLVSGVTGGLQGAASAYGKTTSSEEAKTSIVPLYEDAGAGTERHWDRDVPKAKPADVVSGASLSGPTPKYSKAEPMASKAKAKTAPAARKMTPAELEKLGNEMLAKQQAQSAASLGAGPSVKDRFAARVAKMSEPSYDGKYLEAPKATPAQAAAPPSLQATLASYGEGGAERGDPYAQPAHQDQLLFGNAHRREGYAPGSYAAERADQMGGMFGTGNAPPALAPGSEDYAKAMAHGLSAADRDIATSDPRAKKEAFLAGVDHGAEQALSFHADRGAADLWGKAHKPGEAPAAKLKAPEPYSPLPPPKPPAPEHQQVPTFEVASPYGDPNAPDASGLGLWHPGPQEEGEPEQAPAQASPPAAPAAPPQKFADYFGQIAKNGHTMVSDPKTKNIHHFGNTQHPSRRGPDDDEDEFGASQMESMGPSGAYNRDYPDYNFATLAKESPLNIATAIETKRDAISPETEAYMRREGFWGPKTDALLRDRKLRTEEPDVITSDERAKMFGRGHDSPMADANRSMAPSVYEYKAEFTPPEQQQGEKNVGPMANKMEANPIAATAIVKDPNTGLLAIDKTKGLKLVMGGLADLQRQFDQSKRAQR